MAAGWHHTRDRVTLCVGGEAVAGGNGFHSTMGKAVRWDNKRVPKHSDPSQRARGPIKPRLAQVPADDESDDLILRATREALRRADIR